MDLHLPEHLAHKIERHIGAEFGPTPLDVIETALERLDFQPEQEDAERLLERLSSYRGMAKGWTLNDMLRDRRDGLR